MPQYPARSIISPDEQVNVLQVTDMHLASIDDKVDEKMVSKSYCRQSFEAVINQALSEDIRCDLILVTGDLVNEVQSTTYDYIFEILSATNTPFACIAGNHDVTDEVEAHLPFSQRQLVAKTADNRLLSRHVIDSEYWQMLLLNSAVPGKIAGEISNADIDWLCTQLKTCDKPALIALHHHALPMQSEWIDAHIAKNTAAFWESMAAFKHLKVIISGHTHQEQTRYFNGVTAYTTPSTCYQFQPYEDDFAYDKDVQPGYRWLQLANTGQVASWVNRLDT